jgi:uncharacterized protein
MMYHDGKGVTQDDEEALKWLRKSANQGYATGQDNLGLMYLNGMGVPQDGNEAALWFRKAADQGYGPAQNNIGVAYDKGIGVPQDYIQAYVWFSLAAAASQQGVEHDRATKNRDKVASKMTPEQIAEAKKLAAEWKPKPSQ